MTLTSSTSLTTQTSQPGRGVDPRGLRFSAALTVLALGVALLAGAGPLGTAVLAWQTLVFALGAFVALGASPYAWLFRAVVRPRVGPPAELEAPEPPRFAQVVGFAFAIVGLAAYLLGATLVGQIAVGAALAAAFLNAAFGFCLGCEVYLLSKRILART